MHLALPEGVLTQVPLQIIQALTRHAESKPQLGVVIWFRHAVTVILQACGQSEQVKAQTLLVNEHQAVEIKGKGVCSALLPCCGQLRFNSF